MTKHIDKETRRRIIEYVSGVQTGTISHSNATSGLEQLISDEVNKALDEAIKKVRGMEINIEATEKHLQSKLTGDELEMQILNMRIEADYRKDVLNDAVSAIERVRKDYNGK